MTCTGSAGATQAPPAPLSIAIAEDAPDLARHLRAVLSGALDRRPIRETAPWPSTVAMSSRDWSPPPNVREARGGRRDTCSSAPIPYPAERHHDLSPAPARVPRGAGMDPVCIANEGTCPGTSTRRSCGMPLSPGSHRRRRSSRPRRPDVRRGCCPGSTGSISASLPNAIVRRHNESPPNVPQFRRELRVARTAYVVSSASHALLRELRPTSTGPRSMSTNPPPPPIARCSPRRSGSTTSCSWATSAGSRAWISSIHSWLVCRLTTPSPLRGASRIGSRSPRRPMPRHRGAAHPARAPRSPGPGPCRPDAEPVRNCSMMVLESLATGTVVAGWDVGGHAEIAGPPLLRLVPLGQLDALASVITRPSAGLPGSTRIPGRCQPGHGRFPSGLVTRVAPRQRRDGRRRLSRSRLGWDGARAAGSRPSAPEHRDPADRDRPRIRRPRWLGRALYPASRRRFGRGARPRPPDRYRPATKRAPIPPPEIERVRTAQLDVLLDLAGVYRAHPAGPTARCGVWSFTTETARPTRAGHHTLGGSLRRAGASRRSGRQARPVARRAPGGLVRHAQRILADDRRRHPRGGRRVAGQVCREATQLGEIRSPGVGRPGSAPSPPSGAAPTCCGARTAGWWTCEAGSADRGGCGAGAVGDRDRSRTDRRVPRSPTRLRRDLAPRAFAARVPCRSLRRTLERRIRDSRRALRSTDETGTALRARHLGRARPAPGRTAAPDLSLPVHSRTPSSSSTRGACTALRRCSNPAVSSCSRRSSTRRGGDSSAHCSTASRRRSGLFRHDGRFWILCTHRESADSARTALHAWWAMTLAGPWTPHARHPVKYDVRSARSGGTPFTHRGQLTGRARTARRRTAGPSASTGLHASRRRSTRRRCSVVQPDPEGRYPAGLHTLSAFGDCTLIDGKRSVWCPPWTARTPRAIRRAPSFSRRFPPGPVTPAFQAPSPAANSC